MFTSFSRSIVPIFSIILLGYWLKKQGWLSVAFQEGANRLVYHVAVPAMLFEKIAPSRFSGNFHPSIVPCIGLALVIQVFVSWLVSRKLGLVGGRQGTFVHSCFHGNLGYIAFAVAYYALGGEAFAKTAVASGFLIIGQNVTAVTVLTLVQGQRKAKHMSIRAARSIVTNPIILSVVAGVSWSLSTLSLPVPVDRSLSIVSGMALPTALLLIGATLSFHAVRHTFREIFVVGFLKLMGLPLLAFTLMVVFHVPLSFRVPLLVLFAAPPATVTYIMALEMGGDLELAASSISLLTLASAITYGVLLAYPHLVALGP